MVDISLTPRRKLAFLRAELENGEADIANGRLILLEDDKAVREFFARLTQDSSGCGPRR